jgi:DNA polymerase-4
MAADAARPIRTIFHVDLDAFFVAVERVLDPSLIGKPVIVGGLGQRGVVSTASYEARAFGVHSAQPMAIARRRCPQAVYLPGRHDTYREFSQRFFTVLDDYSPVVSGMSIDEAYIDMTGADRLFGPPVTVAEDIRRRIRQEIGIVASIGIGPNRLVAKVATEDAKPDSVKIVRPEEVERYFASKPVRALPGIGPKAAEALTTLRIETLGQLAEYPLGPLRRALGPNNALWLQMRARGIDNSAVEQRDRAKSISAETTFSEDLVERQDMLDVLRKLSERVGGRLRRSGMHARSVGLKLRYRDFSTVTRQVTLPAAADGDEAIFNAVSDLLRKALNERSGAVRLLGVGVSGLGEPASQLSLLEVDSRKDSAISSAVDRIRDRFGDAAVRRGR